MPAFVDLNLESLPEAISTQDGWWASVHTLVYPVNEEGDHYYPVTYTLISKVCNDGYPRVHHLSAQHGKQRELNPFRIERRNSDLIKPYLPLLGGAESLDMGSLYDQFTISTARTLLTGHYLATQHKGLFDGWMRAGSDEARMKIETDNYWKPRASELGGLTRLTVQIYEELIVIGESSAPSLISILMQTGPRTIHTRLQEARKLSLFKELNPRTRR